MCSNLPLQEQSNNLIPIFYALTLSKPLQKQLSTVSLQTQFSGQIYSNLAVAGLKSRNIGVQTHVLSTALLGPSNPLKICP